MSYDDWCHKHMITPTERIELDRFVENMSYRCTFGDLCTFMLAVRVRNDLRAGLDPATRKPRITQDPHATKA
jgi:hypothetical protein